MDQNIQKRKQHILFLIIPVIILTITLFASREISYVTVVSFFVFLFFNYHIGTNLYHWYWSHKAVKLPKPLEKLFTFLGLFAMVGDPISYAHTHRWHHAHSDTDKDPHSPTQGKFHAFFGWTLKPQHIPLFIIKDLLKPEYLYLRFLADNQKKLVWCSVAVIMLISVDAAMGLLLSMAISFFIENMNNVTGHDSQTRQPRDNPIQTWLQLGTLHARHHKYPNKFFPDEPAYYTMKLFRFI